VVKTVDLVAWLDDLLHTADFEDLGPNGLQVPGRETVERVVTGVSATRALIERAVGLEADLVLVHHGLFWSFDAPGVSPVLAERLRPLFKRDLALAAYHLPLDAHAKHGNNALLAEALGCDAHEPFAAIGRQGTFAGDGIDIHELLARVTRACDREPLHQGAGPGRIRRIGIVSGSAAGSLGAAADAGCDAFLTGEPKEHVMGEATERGIHFIAAGHYATETFGVRRLGELLEREFGLEHAFVDLPNPV
jgi:dinuclear metal center YbgI/SA1388 family protein